METDKEILEKALKYAQKDIIKTVLRTGKYSMFLDPTEEEFLNILSSLNQDE